MMKVIVNQFGFMNVNVMIKDANENQCTNF